MGLACSTRIVAIGDSSENRGTNGAFCALCLLQAMRRLSIGLGRAWHNGAVRLLPNAVLPCPNADAGQILLSRHSDRQDADIAGG